ncbi:MAG: hypothetical protein K6C30_03955, partial [Bacteroidaceae bacterium]|nr:hypothetical protein [Bacteroidaceae bacterium]
NERHPDDFIALSYHNGDVMTLALDYPSAVGGFPNAWIDRIINADPYFGTSDTAFGIEADWKKCQQSIAPADVEATATLNDEQTQVAVSADFTFAVSDDKSHYQVEYILVHDSLHGAGAKWAQVNYYSNYPTTDPNLKYFNTAGGRIPNYYFNDVVIASSRQSAQGGRYRSLPQIVKEAEPVSDTFSFNLNKVVNDSGDELIQDVTQLRVAVLLIDKKTGAIANACQTKVTLPTSILTPEAATSSTQVEAVYDLNGRLRTSLRQGMNIVRDAQGRTRVVNVR